MVPEGRRLFPSLSVEENLLIGGDLRRGARPVGARRDLPAVSDARRQRRGNPATSLSGGEQQMAAIGRALMSNPRLLLCDELSLGLAPVVIRDIYDALPAIRDEGASLVIVEQDIQRALCGRRPRLLPDGGPRHAGRRTADAVARGDPRRLFRRAERMTRLARHADPGRAARRALRALRDEPVADLRHHAAGQPRAWRPDRARHLPDPRSRHVARHRHAARARARRAADVRRRLLRCSASS